MITFHILILVFQSIMALVFSHAITHGTPNKYTYYGLICCCIFIIYEIINLDHLTHH